jgi:hypothetical protein
MMLVECPLKQMKELLNLKNIIIIEKGKKKKLYTNLFNALNAPVAEPGLIKNLLSRSNASNLCV